MKEMRGMGACVMLAMGMGCLLPQTGSFAVPSQSLLLRSRGGVDRSSGVVALRAILDKAGEAAASAALQSASAAASALNKVPLPTSIPIKDIISAAEGTEVKGSLDRFIKSAPEGLKRSAQAMGKTVLPVAKAMLFGDKQESGTPDSLPSGWKENFDTKTGLHYYSHGPSGTTVWKRPSFSDPPPVVSTASAYVSSEAQSVAVVPDSSPQLRDLQKLMQVSVADSLPSAEDRSSSTSSDLPQAAAAAAVFDSSSISLAWDEDEDEEAPSWMIDSSTYKHK